MVECQLPKGLLLAGDAPVPVLYPSQITLGRDDVHIWRARLALPDRAVRQLWHLLSPDERSRANKFRFDDHRIAFIVARGCLRAILSCYLSAEPGEIKFDYSAYGKPSITNSAAAAADLRFNLAHSGGLALYAIARGCEIGIDLEMIPPTFAWNEIARRFFSRNEVVKLGSLPANLQQRAFFNCWTRKEAFLKAKGVGFSQALDQFEVTLAPDEPVAVLETKWDLMESSRWILKSLDVGEDFAAAIAVEGQDLEISVRDFNDGMIPIS